MPWLLDIISAVLSRTRGSTAAVCISTQGTRDGRSLQRRVRTAVCRMNPASQPVWPHGHDRRNGRRPPVARVNRRAEKEEIKVGTVEEVLWESGRKLEKGARGRQDTQRTSRHASGQTKAGRYKANIVMHVQHLRYLISSTWLCLEIAVIGKVRGQCNIDSVAGQGHVCGKKQQTLNRSIALDTETPISRPLLASSTYITIFTGTKHTSSALFLR
ncbi:hypothetical protein THASP1DRAFT_23547 [Thamnocephalis sphaerospora]|uniref:Uncharacterized protein n=1 Tax=Thamnocephalis sphaerospora TaxID=78915 RepID=A0A4P9XQY2_9FUNG|nr:hypothetical protein THASP1DRAFT_23547 [Thamnocephalis sphaerospora]|eukprot:RKP08466.1 hypothetical protein THASP1DRAFT_23547 [Thamnocephalis sphaerospora]